LIGHPRLAAGITNGLDMTCIAPRLNLSNNILSSRRELQGHADAARHEAEATQQQRRARFARELTLEEIKSRRAGQLTLSRMIWRRP
jgi:hypothetical protein